MVPWVSNEGICSYLCTSERNLEQAMKPMTAYADLEV